VLHAVNKQLRRKQAGCVGGDALALVGGVGEGDTVGAKWLSECTLAGLVDAFIISWWF
jgi:hypothetical protein